MSIRRNLFLALLIINYILPISAQESMEDLLWNDEIKIVTASKTMQNLSESPTVVKVVTSEDIRKSGVLSLPDLLRRISGIDIIQTGAARYDISIRGYNDSWSHRLLLLIDGRSVYSDFYGNIDWNSIPVTLDEIEQIEIIKGPGSSLYGVNAYLGVINIITKKIEKLPHYSTYVTRGNQGTLKFGVIASGVKKNWSYKMSLERFITNRWKTYNLSGKKAADYYFSTIKATILDSINTIMNMEDLDFQGAFREYYFQSNGGYPSSEMTFNDYFTQIKAENYEEVVNTISKENSTFFQRVNSYIRDKRGLESTRFNSQFDLYFNSNIDLSLNAGYSEFTTDVIAYYELFKYVYTSRFPYLYSQMNFRRFLTQNSDLSIKAYYNYIDKEIFNPLYYETPNYEVKNRTFDFELLHSISINDRHKYNLFSYGVNYRRNNITSNLFQPNYRFPFKRYKKNQIALFWQKQMILCSNVAFHYGERYDIHPDHGFLRSPRISAIFSLSKHSLRLSHSKAYRSPSFFESYVDYESIKGGSLPTNGSSKSNQGELKPERVFSTQISFGRKIPHDKKGLSYNIAIYYNQLSDLINTFLINEEKDIFFYRFYNLGESEAIGGEVDLNYKSDYFDFFFNTSYTHIDDKKYSVSELKKSIPNIHLDTVPSYSDDIYTGGFSEIAYCGLITENQKTPKLKINSGFSLFYKKSYLTLTNYYVGKIKKWFDVSTISVLSSPSYFYQDLSFGITYQSLSISFYIKNLLNNKHYEYPPNDYSHDNIGDLNGYYLLGIGQSERIGRIFTFTVKMDF